MMNGRLPTDPTKTGTAKRQSVLVVSLLSQIAPAVCGHRDQCPSLAFFFTCVPTEGRTVWNRPCDEK